MQEIPEEKPPFFKLHPFIKKYLVHIIIVSIVVIASIGWFANYMYKQQSPKSKAAELPTRTWTVCAQGQNCDFYRFEGIQQAINAANNGDTIQIVAGTYLTSQGPAPGVVINNKNLTIQGDSKENTIIDGSTNTDEVSIVNIVGTSNISIKNISIIGNLNGVLRQSGIVLRDSSTINLSNSIIANNFSDGILLLNTSHGSIKGNILRSNSKAIESHDNSVITIDNNLIINNGHPDRGSSGILLYDSANANIANNTIYNNQGNGGLYIYGNQNVHVVFFNNIISEQRKYGDGSGGWAILLSHGSMTNNFSYNLFYANQSGCAYGNDGSWCTQNGSLDNTPPRFISEDPNNPNFHLDNLSLARLAGDPSILNPDGTRSDMGAYGGPGACILDANLPGCLPVSVTPSPTFIPSPTLQPTNVPTPSPTFIPSPTLQPTNVPTPTSGSNLSIQVTLSCGLYNARYDSFRPTVNWTPSILAQSVIVQDVQNQRRHLTATNVYPPQQVQLEVANGRTIRARVTVSGREFTSQTLCTH